MRRRLSYSYAAAEISKPTSLAPGAAHHFFFSYNQREIDSAQPEIILPDTYKEKQKKVSLKKLHAVKQNMPFSYLICCEQLKLFAQRLVLGRSCLYMFHSLFSKF